MKIGRDQVSEDQTDEKKRKEHESEDRGLLEPLPIVVKKGNSPEL